MKRRTFFKNLAGSVFLYTLPSQVKAQASEQSRQNLDSELNIDRDLKFLDRHSLDWPREANGYHSSYYKVLFLPKDPSTDGSRFTFTLQFLNENLEPIDQKFDCNFTVERRNNETIFSSLDQKYFLMWKAKFGLYSLHNEDHSRIIEHCEPADGNKSRYLNDVRVVVPLGHTDSFYSKWVRWSYWMNGGPKSPLQGFEGFAEESLALDASEDRDANVAIGLDWFLNSIPFGLPALKLLAKSSPDGATKLLEKLIPKVFGWMLGPTQITEHGKLVLSDCPYRKRLGTQVCETTCGHSIGKYFTNQVGIPLRFNPTVDGYTKCHILIGKDQVLAKNESSQ